jgi:flagellar biosynthesis/type III secretory pathway chaperone
MTNKILTQGGVISVITKSLKELLVIIEKENELLKIGKVSAIAAVIEEKVASLKKFNNAQINIENYARQGGEFDAETPVMLSLKGLFAKLDELNRDNEVLIKSNLEVSEKIVEMYKNNKTQETLRQFGYNKEGNIAGGKIEKIMPSIGLNNKV